MPFSCALTAGEKVKSSPFAGRREQRRLESPNVRLRGDLPRLPRLEVEKFQESLDFVLCLWQNKENTYEALSKKLYRMRKPILLSFFAFAVLSSFSFNCGGSESKQAIQATLSSSDLSIVMASLKSVAGTAFQTTATEHFTIVHEVGAEDIAGTGRALESAYQRFYDVFANAGFELSRSGDRLVWICFPQQSGFNKYALRAEGMDLSWLDGYYSTLTNRVAVVQPNLRMADREPVHLPRADDMRITLAANKQQSEKVLPMSPPGQRLDMTRLTHELAHQLAFNSGIQRRGVMYPIWVSEGLATNFESSSVMNAGVLSSNMARSSCLATAYAAGELIPLRQLIVQTRVPADADVSRQHYAQAWAFFRFLLAERPASLRIYLNRVAGLSAGRRNAEILLSEFIDVFGAPESLERAWIAFVVCQAQSDSAE